MKRSILIAGVILAFSMLEPLVAWGGGPAQLPLWVTVDDLLIREGPGPEAKIAGTLPRGAQLTQKAAPLEGYCLVSGEGKSGYVACQYLSRVRVLRLQAGENGVDAAQRWISANGVTLRDAPRQDANVAGRLALNTVVKLLRGESGNAYCEVQTSNGLSGFTACRYLVTTPVVMDHVRGVRVGDEALSPDYDPERAFWLKPGWYALVEYAQYLKEQHPGIPSQGPWPRNEPLERMKAHLALGLKGEKPVPYADWSLLKRKAAQDFDLSGNVRRLRAKDKSIPEKDEDRDLSMHREAEELQTSIRINGPLHDAPAKDGGAERVIRLVRSLEFPSVSPSLFHSEGEISPPYASTEQASGRFGIVYRQLITPRSKPKPGVEGQNDAGFYDMLARTQSLVRPVQRVQLFRDGRLKVEKSFVRNRETLWYDADEPECSGWIPGFLFGDAEIGIWRYFGSEAANMKKLNRNPAGGLFAFYTSIELSTGTAVRTEVPMKLNRNETGFIRGISVLYDMNGDGIPDLAVWEGQGKGPGHLDEPATTDDRWYRLVLVNINGAWKVLGSDSFEYGCGC